jgi:hypothetical protein
VHRLTRGDARLIAMLTLLRDELAPVVDELTFGELSPEDRRALARALRRVADTLEPDPVVLVNVDPPVTRSDVA